MKMKMTFRSLLTLTLCLSLILFSSCNDDDEIHIDKLAGLWQVVNDDPELAVDGALIYGFAADSTFSLQSVDYASHLDTTVYGTYTVSNDHELLTLKFENSTFQPIDAEGNHYEQYYIRSLEGEEMHWEDILYDEVSGKRAITHLFALHTWGTN